MMRTREFVFRDRLLDWSATLPWWLDSIVAVLVFALLQMLSQGTQPLPHEPAPQGWLSDLVLYGRFVVPALFLMMAAASVWRRHQRKRLIQQAAVNPSADMLDKLSQRDFELLVAEMFRIQGYEVDDLGSDSTDQGVNLVLWQNDCKTLVQCKPWTSYRVGVEVVRELTGLMHAVGASSAFLVTSGTFTRAARHFAAGQAVKLLDGAALREWIAKVQARQTASAANTAPASATPGTPTKAGLLAARHGEVQPPLDAAALLALAQAREAVIPACPRCGKAMQRQAARTDAQGGPSFWGCTAFPSCRGTRELLQSARL
ncbi:restriction endonuclease [Curvibacter gracilis]|uniref:restriction endonuclease n=1 Tax=Curvibacter gracilis TaxID=230310 RepID=UPI0004842DBE|nr:restriction endonuclease [Curvibacter gracilis]